MYENKALTQYLSPLESTLTKNRGGGVRQHKVNQPKVIRTGREQNLCAQSDGTIPTERSGVVAEQGYKGLMPEREKLGFVTCPSGVLIVMDTGYLGIWSHNQPPILPDGILETEEATAHANAFVDLRIVGADAEQAGRMLAMSWHPLFIYDQPADHPELDAKLANLVRTHGLDAHFQVVSPRIPHRQRVNQAIQQGAGAGEILIHGIWASVVSDVPNSVPLAVFGERLGRGEKEQWARVLVECRPQTRIVRSEKVGSVGVDYARLLIADVDALGEWQHEKSLDGLADYTFWGRDAEAAAHALHAPRLGADEFGWTDVRENLAQERGLAVENYREAKNLKFAADYRPHSHHWRVMKPTRVSRTESGTTEVGGATMCNFMTSWGDGLFEVYRDVAQSGALVQIRIEFCETSATSG